MAAFGEDILPWLNAQDGAEANVLRHCIHAAALIGGSGGLEALSRYSRSVAGAELQESFVEEWDRFNPEEFTDRVLANLPLSSTLHVPSGRVLQSVGRLPQARKLKIDAKNGLRDLRPLAGLRNLQELDVGSLNSLRSLEGLGSLRTLKSLFLKGMVEIVDFQEIALLMQLRHLYLDGCSQLVDPAPLSELKHLRTLSLARCVSLRKFDWIGGLTELWNLELSGCYSSDLSFCSSLREVRKLRARVATGITGTVDLSQCDNLRSVMLKFDGTHYWSLPSSSSLRTVVIAGQLTDADLGVISSCPFITEIVIEDARLITDIGSLSSLPRLERLVMLDLAGVNSMVPLSRSSKLRWLQVTNCRIEDVDFASGLTALELLNLDGCRELESLNGLRGLRNLRSVSLEDGVRRVDETALEQISQEVGFSYTHNPYDPHDYFTG